MIKISVDEAYAFDYLSILQVKNMRYPTEKNATTFSECFNTIKNECDITESIVESEQYKELLSINLHTFDLIDALREGKPISAKEIDDANMDRFYKKQALQERFFNHSLTEEKITK